MARTNSGKMDSTTKVAMITGIFLVCAALVPALLNPAFFSQVFHTQRSSVSSSPTPLPQVTDDTPPTFPKDFFQRNDGFFAGIRRDFTPLPSKNVACQTNTIFQYVTKEHQIGFHAYLGLHTASQGTFKVKVQGNNQSADKKLSFFSWNINQPTTTLYTKESNGDVEVGPGNFDNTVLYRYYPEATSADFFVLPTSEFYAPNSADKSPFTSIIVVKNTDLNIYNPNKYIFEIDPATHRMTFSNRVYRQCSPSVANKVKDFSNIISVLKRFEVSERKLTLNDLKSVRFSGQFIDVRYFSFCV